MRRQKFFIAQLLFAAWTLTLIQSVLPGLVFCSKPGQSLRVEFASLEGRCDCCPQLSFPEPVPAGSCFQRPAGCQDSPLLSDGCNLLQCDDGVPNLSSGCVGGGIPAAESPCTLPLPSFQAELISAPPGASNPSPRLC